MATCEHYGERGVCEAHPDRPVNHDGCTDAADPCPMYDAGEPPRPPRGFVSYMKDDL